MKKTILSVLSVLALQTPALAEEYDYIQVSGQSEVKIKPEFVTLTVTVYSRAMQAKDAQKMNAREMAKVEKILKQDFKIESKEIQTGQFQVTPQYDYNREQQVYKGMSVTHSLLIKYRKLDDLGSLLDKLVEGPNKEDFGVRIDHLSFGSDQMRASEILALEKAVADARARGQALAKAAGKSLQEVRRISDSQIQLPSFEQQRFRGAPAYAMSADKAETSIAPGELSVRADVKVEFEIK